MASKGKTSPAPDKKAPWFMKYVIGGLSGMGATCCVQPLDLVKTRIQVSTPGEYKGTFDAIIKIVRKEGITGVYKGLGAGLLRQATYTTGRLGVFSALNEMYKEKYNKTPNLLISMAMGMAAGSAGSIIGTPAEVALIRMTADGRLPLAERRNYSGVFNALARITREEGLFTLWRGVMPTMGRAMVVNMAQLATYSQAKEQLILQCGMVDGIKMHFVASMISGFVTTAASMPVDLAKTRIQNMNTAAGAKPEYKGSIDVLLKVSQKEGVFKLWKGFTPYFLRLGPHTVITFILMEQMHILYKSSMK